MVNFRITVVCKRLKKIKITEKGNCSPPIINKHLNGYFVLIETIISNLR